METLADQHSISEKYYLQYQVYEQPGVATIVHAIDVAAAAAVVPQASVEAFVTSV